MFNSSILSDKINSFDFYYEMSDSNLVYDRGMRSERSIKEDLSQLTQDELYQIRDQITVDMELVKRYFSDYFQELASSSQEAQGEHQSDSEPETSEPSSKSFRAQIFTDAWSMIKSGHFTSFSEALRASWHKFKLMNQLRKGIAYFTFVKASGEIREAIGTLAKNNFEYINKRPTKATKHDIINYWDIQKRSWRSCRVDRLVS